MSSQLFLLSLPSLPSLSTLFLFQLNGFLSSLSLSPPSCLSVQHVACGKEASCCLALIDGLIMPKWQDADMCNELCSLPLPLSLLPSPSLSFNESHKRRQPAINFRVGIGAGITTLQIPLTTILYHVSPPRCANTFT